MECIYFPDLEENQTDIEISGPEAKHLKVLNTAENAGVLVSNGGGLAAITKATRTGKEKYILNIISIHHEYGELPYRLGLALGILDKRDRFEFALEKSIEMGITDFYPLISRYTQKNKIQSERLRAKAVAAMKQCKRSRLPIIHNPIAIGDLSDTAREYGSVLLLDENGEKPHFNNDKHSRLIVCGPEGGFSEQEISQISALQNCKRINLGGRRLRAETAAILATGISSV